MSKIFLPTQLKDYYSFFQVPARKWWFGLIGLAGSVIIALGYLLPFGLLSGVEFLTDAEEWIRPIRMLISSLQLGGFIGVAVLLSWIFYRQGFGWLSSVVGRFRWKWFAITSAVFGAGFLLLNIGDALLLPPPAGLYRAVRPYTFFMVMSALLITPFQAAGEEYIFRGIWGRLIAAFVPFRKTGLCLSFIVPTVLFVLMHQDEFLLNNINYISMSLCTWWLAHRTGGIEASVAFHATINTTSQIVLLPFVDLAVTPARANPEVLYFLPLLFSQVVLTLVVDFLARRYGLVKMSSPAAPAPEVVKAKKPASPAEPATKKDLPRLDMTARPG